VRRIGINLLWLVPGEVGGSEEYTIGLLRALHDWDVDDLEIILYVNRRFARDHREVCAMFTTIVAPIEGGSRPLRVLAESIWLARRARTDRVDAIHHAGGTMPPIRTVAGIVTLHDLQPITHPERFGPIKRTYIRVLAPRSLRAATAVVCLASFTARDAVEVAGVDPDRLVLVPCGIDPVADAPTAERTAEVLDDLDLVAGHFIVYPAITYEHKNHRTLIDAFARLRGNHPDLRLVLTGGVGPVEPAVVDQIARLGLVADVRRTGRVPADVLDVLLRSAAVMAFPSSYEGFGLPALEAMARGCPVVASAVGGLIEVGGPAADLVAPFDVDAWVTALAGVLVEEGYRATMIGRGLEQSSRFQWSDSAHALADLYRSLPAGRKAPSAP
jgi:glycosyltransferase involved in cell wall biosynthesis